MSISLEISNFLGEFDVTYATIEQITRLEDYIAQANRFADETNKGGAMQYLIEDAMYDDLMSKLRAVRPDSPLLTTMWEIGVQEITELDVWLTQEPMQSILTAKSLVCPEYLTFLKEVRNEFDDEELIKIILSAKLNGHGIRLIYLDGIFQKATSRARNSNGRDLTEPMRTYLVKRGLIDIEDLYDTGLVEIRGELLVNFDNYEKAKEYVPGLVSPLFAVASMSRASASEEEFSLLSFVAYRIMIDNIEFDDKEEEYEYLQELNFEIPIYVVYELDLEDLEDENFIEYVTEFEELIFAEGEEYNFYTDGIVCQVNDTPRFSNMGSSGKYNLGNVALKVGRWEQNGYVGYVQMIRWKQGKSKLSPVAIVSEQPDDIIFEYEGETYFGYDALDEALDLQNSGIDPYKLIKNYKSLGVPTASGASVKRVPLYEPANLFLLNLGIGQPLHFKFGGEAAVVPTDDKGRLLNTLKSLEEEEYDADDEIEIGFNWYEASQR